MIQLVEIFEMLALWLSRVPMGMPVGFDFTGDLCDYENDFRYGIPA